MVMRCSVGRLTSLLGGRTPRVRPGVYPERKLVMSTNITATTPPAEFNKEQGWNRNTDCCMDVKTFLRSDCITKIGKDYSGILTRDQEDHYCFIETVPPPSLTVKRNPCVFNGKFFTVTRKDDGRYRLNFKPMKVGRDFSVESYAIGVADELRQALNGLIEK